MKKSIFTFLMILIATVAFSSSAQNVNIVGTWKGKTSGASDNPKDSMKGVIYYTHTFNANGTGTISFNGTVQGKIDDESQVKIRLKGSSPISWTKKDNVITITSNPSQLNIDLTEKDVELTCTDPEMQSIMNSYKPHLVKMMRRKIKSSLKSDISKSQWKIIKSEGNSLTINENGNTIKLTRVK